MSQRGTTQRTPGRTIRKRAPRVSGDERKKEILLAAQDVFGARGYHKASLGEIAERVGLTHQGVLHHFGSKEQLFVEVLALREQLDVADFENHEPPHGPDLLRHLVSTAEVNAGRAGLVQAYVVLSAESVTEDHPAQTSFRERFAVLRRLIADALAASVPSGAVSEQEIDDAACAVIAVMDGLQVQWLLEPDAVRMPETVSLVIEALLHRLRSQVELPGAPD